MANAVIPRNQGDDYQARFFWLCACRLFQPHTRVARVGYELDCIKSFDDVVVNYAEPLRVERGDVVAADYYQIKFHVSQAGAFTCDALTDPAFINASAVSLLKKIHTAHKSLVACGSGYRLIVLSPWPIHPDDPLAALVSNNGGELRLEVLLRGGPQSKIGKVRRKWKQHLNLADDEELIEVLRPLRIYRDSPDLNGLNERLNLHLELAGFVPLEAGRMAHPYDDLIRKLKAQGSNEFTRDQLQEVCEREKLWRGSPRPDDDAGKIGIRSFMRFAEFMEDETEAMLDLVASFEGRFIRQQEHWPQVIFPQVRDFLTKYARTAKPYHLLLDTHSSVAFAAGYCLEIKSGANVAPVQRVRNGKVVWQPFPESAADSYSGWTLSDISTASDEHDVAVAISITHDVFGDVRDFVSKELAQVRRILHCRAEPQPGNSSVRDGTHAVQLAQALTALFKQRSRDERAGTLHIFAAAPNAFMFFLGQLARGFGACVLYEYDFESGAPGAYRASLSFPPPTKQMAT